MISSLSSMMRYSLSDPQEDVTVEDEIGYLKKYISDYEAAVSGAV